MAACRREEAELNELRDERRDKRQVKAMLEGQKAERDSALLLKEEKERGLDLYNKAKHPVLTQVPTAKLGTDREFHVLEVGPHEEGYESREKGVLH